MMFSTTAFAGGAPSLSYRLKCQNVDKLSTIQKVDFSYAVGTASNPIDNPTVVIHGELNGQRFSAYKAKAWKRVDDRFSVLPQQDIKELTSVMSSITLEASYDGIDKTQYKVTLVTANSSTLIEEVGTLKCREFLP